MAQEIEKVEKTAINRLTAKQERFCQEYIIDCNGTQAAIRAGYSERTAQEQSSRLLSKVMVQQRVAELQANVARRLDIKAENVLQELARVGFSNIGDYVAWGPDGVRLRPSEDMTPEQWAAVSEVVDVFGSDGRSGIKFKLHDKLAALIQLGKHLKLFVDRVEHEAGETMADVVAAMYRKRLAEQNGDIPSGDQTAAE